MKEIQEIYSYLSEDPLVKSLFENLPNFGLILNEQRQILFSNNKFLNFLGIIDIKESLGARQGEAIHCENSHKTDGGCGTSKNCRYCGVISAVLESQSKNIRVEKEARIYSIIGDRGKNMDFKVTVSPLKYRDYNLSVLSLEDISSAKRRDVLEKTFLHDISNAVSSLSLLTEMIPEEYPELSDIEEMNLLFNQCRVIIEEVEAQKDLKFAEERNLDVKMKEFYMLDIITDIEKSFRVMLDERGMTLEYPECDLKVYSDKRLLRRVIYNLVKNAFEASEKGDVVTISYEKNENLEISVNNKAVVSEKVKAQMFRKSFSTKGKGRGVGTYSVKLLTEEYLGGKVSLRSEEGEGTTVKISLPV